MTDLPAHLPMLRYVLDYVLTQVGVNNRDLPSPFLLRYNGSDRDETEMWRKAVMAGCLNVIGNALPETDTCANLVRRAARMISQAGEIHWDDPENDAQRDGEKPWITEKQAFVVKEDKRSKRAKELAQRRAIAFLTDEEKAELLKQEPLLPDSRVGNGKDMAPHLPIDKATFVFNSIGVIFGSYNNSELASRMTRMGLIDLVNGRYRNGDPYVNGATVCDYQLGPRYLAYMHRWKILPYRYGTTSHFWKETVKRLNAQWGTSYKASDWEKTND